MPRRREQDDIPSTVAHSGAKARRTWKEAHDSAVDTYDEGERAHRTAFAALKHTQRAGRWPLAAQGRRGPSDRQAAKGGSSARASSTPTAGGVDANASTTHRYEVARKLDVPGRSSMSKQELVEAIDKASRRRTRKARER